MLGIKFANFDNQTYVIRYSALKSEKIKKEGFGLSFLYFAPVSKIIAVPVGTRDIQFITTTVTKDFQTLSLQVQIIHRVSEPEKTALFFDFTVDRNLKPKRDNMAKIDQFLISKAKNLVLEHLKDISLEGTFRNSDQIKKYLLNEITKETGEIQGKGADTSEKDTHTTADPANQVEEDDQKSITKIQEDIQKLEKEIQQLALQLNEEVRTIKAEIQANAQNVEKLNPKLLPKIQQIEKLMSKLQKIETKAQNERQKTLRTECKNIRLPGTEYP